jgi:hypothetical protein
MLFVQGGYMGLECRIFKRENDGKIRLVEIVTHEEILENTNYKSSFNTHPREKLKNQPRKKRKQN